MIDLLAGCLLRRHVSQSAHGDAELRLSHFLRRLACRDFCEFYQTKVQNFHITIGAHHHVVRFDVAMNNAGLMSG